MTGRESHQHSSGENRAKSAGPPPAMIHIPTPGDHYSEATGSATMSVIHELTRCQLAAGGMSRIIVGSGTLHDIPDGQCQEVEFGPDRTVANKVCDMLLGGIGLPRRSDCRRYRPALSAIEPDFDGVILVYNCANILGEITAARPCAKVCLYAVNALFRSYGRAEVRRVVDQAHRVICCSRFIADDLVNHLGRPSPKIKVVYNGVDTQRFVPPPALTAESPLKILFVGRATPRKGPDLLLKAAQLLHGKTAPFKVRIVGSQGFAPSRMLSPYERILRDLAEPIRDIVEFQASIARHQLLTEYHAAGIFCAPSNWDDPFPLTVLEAQACGLPVVASRRGGIPEGAADNILLFDPPDVRELAERLRFFIENPAERIAWGIRGRARVENLDWSNQYKILQDALI